MCASGLRRLLATAPSVTTAAGAAAAPKTTTTTATAAATTTDTAAAATAPAIPLPLPTAFAAKRCLLLAASEVRWPGQRRCAPRFPAHDSVSPGGQEGNGQKS